IERLGQFRWAGTSIYAWLRQIAIHKAYDVHRAARRTTAALEQLRVNTPVVSERDELADAMLIAAEEMTANRRRIDDALGAINPRYRKAIELRLIEERPRLECASALDVTPGTFDVLLFPAVRAFRKRFGERQAEVLAPASRPTPTRRPRRRPVATKRGKPRRSAGCSDRCSTARRCRQPSTAISEPCSRPPARSWHRPGSSSSTTPLAGGWSMTPSSERWRSAA